MSPVPAAASMKGFIIFAGLAAALAIHAYAGTFTDNFSPGLSSTYWSIVSSELSDYSVNAPGGYVALSKIGTTSGNVAVSISLNLAALGGDISGNFLDQINFSNAQIGPNLDQVQLDDSFADGSLFDDVYDLSSGLNVHVWNGAVQNATSITGTSGTFAIGRTGSTVTGYFDGTAFFSETETSALDYIDFRLETQPDASTDSSSVTFTNFSLTAASVPEPDSVWLMALGGVACFVGRKRGKISGRQKQGRAYSSCLN